jgi:hypothetical protein
MIVSHTHKQQLENRVIHEIPIQRHDQTRGHQVHLDITDHHDPSVTIAVDFEISTNGGQTWSYGGGFTKAGGDTVDKNGDKMSHISVNFGHEPTPKQIDASGQVIGKDPAPSRLVRGSLFVLPSLTAHVAGIVIPGAPTVLVAAGYRKTSFLNDYARSKSISVTTRIHVAGTSGSHFDPTLVPSDY